MFEQHPVPQQISSYQFRLVGDMTLKQFFQLAAGAVLGLIMYATPLPSIFKWPLIVLFVVAGAAFAFLPLQERPLEEWISAFFRAVYGPTQYRWKKDSNVSYFASANIAPTTAIPSTIPGQTKITDASVTKMETKENNFLANISDMFSLHQKTTTSVTQPNTAVPVVQIPGNNVLVPETSLPLNVSTTIQSEILQNASKPAAVVAYTPPTPIAGTLFVATPATPAITMQQHSGFAQTEVKQSGSATGTLAPIEQTLHPQTEESAVAVQFSPDAAPPSPATIPNVIVGQVMTAQNKIVEGAILEIKDFQGRPVRALKTNKAGHFMIVTPLPNGSYQMNVEKEGLTFSPLSFEIHGAIISPMAVKANA